MMLGEQHRPSPTINVPPWTIVDEPNPELFSPYSGDASSVSDYSRYYLQEALAALQRYLPSNDPEMDSDGEILDSPVDAYSCDHFRMYEFKVRRCARGRSHDWTECPYAHPGEKARRRDPRKYHYSGTACPDFRKGSCKKGDACEFAHGVFECWLHPARYRTQPCKDGPNCRRRVCFFAHTPEQLRVLTHHSPTSLSSAESCEALPLRQAIEASCTKSLPFLSSPVSVSPPASPLVESPPITPSLSRSLGSNSINEMVTSMRKLQMGRFKSLPSSWNIQVGGSGFGSVKGSMIGPGFCSLPTTPTAPLLTRSGRGYPDFWDKALEEEPAMERVESGRDLRAKMLEKLSMENSLDRVDQDPGESIGAPDLGWAAPVSRFLLPGGLLLKTHLLKSKMDNFNLQRKPITSYEEARGLFSISNPIGPVVCPKPRRVGILANSPIRPVWWQMSHQAEICDSKTEADLLDIMLMKECHGAEHQSQAASPPFFYGSPPIRTANPLIQDARFGDETPSSIPSPSGLSSPSSSSSSHKGGCARMKFGLKPAAVRVEGFDCLNRDRQHSSIPAVA